MENNPYLSKNTTKANVEVHGLKIYAEIYDRRKSLFLRDIGFEQFLSKLHSGEYTKGVGALRRGDSYCSLGILGEQILDLYPNRESRIFRYSDDPVDLFAYQFSGESNDIYTHSLPDRFFTLFNIFIVPENGANKRFDTFSTFMIHLNDRLGLSFEEIADVLETLEREIQNG